jgi:hypothetical protein
VTSESATSDLQLRQAAIGVLAFLLTPGLFLMVETFPAFELTVRFRPERVEDFLAGLAFVFVTYSFVAIGVLAAFVWDALAFDRRDAMVLGPLPLDGRTVVAAKLAALGLLLLGASGAVSLVSAVPFGLITANRFGLAVFLRHTTAHLVATTAAAAFVFSAMVFVRGAAAAAGSARLAGRLGSLLQFLLVAATLSFVILIPTAAIDAGPALLEGSTLRRLPTTWFVGLFEWIRGSARPGLPPLATRALLATSIAVAGAILVSAAGYRRQMQLALVPAAAPGALGAAHVSRAIARRLAGRRREARALADFILLTLARSRAQQTPIALNAAIGLVVVIAGLAAAGPDVAALMRPRTAVLWIPLVCAYWLAIGVRASFFVPSELASSWIFRVASCGPVDRRAAVRASMIAYVLPRTLAVAALLVVPLGARLAAWHALLTGLAALLLVQVVALRMAEMPFTRPYRPGHARLKTRWPLYLLGLYIFAYWPARLELQLLGSVEVLTVCALSMAGAAGGLDILGRSRLVGSRPDEPDTNPDEEVGSLSVLGLEGASGTRAA